MSSPQQLLAFALLAVGLVATVLAARYRLPRVAALLLMAAGAFLVLSTSHTPRARLVIIADDDYPELDAALARQGRELSVSDCIVLLRGPKIDPRVPKWQPRCGAVAGSEASLSTLLHVAFTQFERLSWTEVLSDAFANRSRQILLLPGPSRLGADVGATIETGRFAKIARKLDVMVDTLDTADDDQQAGKPTLRIRPLQGSATALKNDGVEQFSFELLLAHSSEPKEAQVACVFAGSCASDADCGKGAPRCVTGHCTVACTTDADCRSDETGAATCNAAACTTEGEFESARGLASRKVTATASGAELSLGTFRLSEFTFLGRDTGSHLSRRWYPLTCRATYARERDERTVETTTYILATSDGFGVLWGNAGRLGPSATARTTAASRAAALDALIQQTAERSSLQFVGPALTEGSLGAGGEPFYGKLEGDVPLRLLLIDDASTAFWQKRCPDIVRFVEGGGNVVVSAPPPKVPCPLPAFAADPDPAPYVDAKPIITFVLDASRIGRMTFESHSKPVLEDYADVVKRALMDGLEDLQVPVLSSVANAFGWQLVKDDLRPRADSAELPFFTLRVFPDLAAARPEGRGKQTSEMATESALHGRLALPPRDTSRLGPDDLYVVFAYDIRTSSAKNNQLERLLGSGARVVVVPIDTTFGSAFASGPRLHDLLADWHVGDSAPYAKEANLRDRLEVATPGGVVPAAQWSGGAVSLSKRDDVAAVSKTLAAHIRVLYGPDAESFASVRGFHRFVDPRLDGALSAVVPQGARAQPLRMQRLTPNADLSVDATLLVTRSSPKSIPGALGPAPLTYGSVHGQGHILVTGYSLFDGSGEPALKHPYLDHVHRLFTTPQVAELGARSFGGLAQRTDRLAPLPTDAPRLVEMNVRDRRFVELEVSQRSKNLKVDALYMTTSGRCTAKDFDGDTAASLALIGVDPKSQVSTFSLSPLQRMRLCAGNPCRVSLCRKTCRGTDTACEVESGEADILLEAISDTASKPTENLSLLRQVDWLRALTNGRDRAPFGRARDGSALARAFCIAAVVAFLVARTFGRWRRALRLRGEAKKQSSSDPTQGLLRGSAEALGLPLPSLPAGAFAGFRPLEAGDGIRSIERRALLAATMLHPGRFSNIPPVALRVDTSPRSVAIFVDGSAVMRIGGGPELPPKLDAARRVATLLAEAGRSLNAQLSLRSFGTVGAGAEAGGANNILTVAEVRTFFEQLLVTQPSPAGRVRLPDEPGASMIVISDFIGHDLNGFASDVERAYDEGSPVGVVVVAAEAEYQQTHLGRIPGTNTFADRTHLDSKHLRDIYVAHQKRVEAQLAEATGGVTVIHAELSDQQLTALLLESRLVELLR